MQISPDKDRSVFEARAGGASGTGAQKHFRQPTETAPARIEPLARLPVFLDLAGKKVVVAGGTDALTWKSELMAAAGADVEIYAVSLAPAMKELLARSALAKQLTHLDRAWSADCLAGAAVAIADVDTEQEAEAFAAAARSAGVLANVVDRPKYCRFELGSIVNRSPLLVAVSTAGAAPILAQSVRSRIEALLPKFLGEWAKLARDVRDVVAKQVPQPLQRKTFWRLFAEAAFRSPPGQDARNICDHLMAETSRKAAATVGCVTLVGAGPGAAEFLTLKALRALQSADVVLFDDLVSAEVLELARREARRIRVGKRGHKESCAQEDIQDLMISLAADGKNVVRLKSGDPMIFGRAGEEIAALKRHDIRVEVVPGVTSALAAAASLGVSLTHRDCAHSVRFVTGHGRNGRLADDLDWRGLADPATTLVVYMGGRTAPQIAEHLMLAGREPETPLVVMANAGCADERRWLGTLASLASARENTSGDQPVLIGIGAVFASANGRPRA